MEIYLIENLFGDFLILSKIHDINPRKIIVTVRLRIMHTTFVHIGRCSKGGPTLQLHLNKEYNAVQEKRKYLGE